MNGMQINLGIGYGMTCDIMIPSLLPLLKLCSLINQPFSSKSWAASTGGNSVGFYTGFLTCSP